MVAREPDHICVHEDDFKQMAITMVKIEGRLEKYLDRVTNYVESGKYWRATVVGLIISLVLSGVGWVMWGLRLSKDYGQLERQVTINTARWDRYLSHMTHEIEAMDKKEGK
jgi:cytochrome b subunit of formate dehydrogenase